MAKVLYFSFSISPSNEYSGLVSFRMDWLNLLAVQGTLKSLLQHHSSKASVLQPSAFFMVQFSHSYMTTEKAISLTTWIFVGKVVSLLFIFFLVSCLCFYFFFILFFSIIFISWRPITLQYCSGFCHTLTWISHGFTCIPHPDPPSHLPFHPIPLGLPSAPAPSTCLMHPTWAGDLFHPW